VTNGEVNDGEPLVYRARRMGWRLV
jgi:hypothetical protein